MKKMDLHIHSLSTISDRPFEFSLKKLKEYVETCSLDCIAITNHNKFDRTQFEEICDALEDDCVVLPGIEINVGKNAGHMLCISDIDNLDTFTEKANLIESRIQEASDVIPFEELCSIFDNLEEYLWIPHYDKKPSVDKNFLKKMGENIICGEVKSIKKFMYCQNDSNELTPVYFSDFRPIDDCDEFPIRHTFFDLSEVSIRTIKICLLDKSKVTLSEQDGNYRFEALPGLILSTGLNVIVGERSSGKSYTLDKLILEYPDAKYIKQFSLLETDPEKAAKEFTDRIADKKRSVVEEYFALFANVVSEVKDISIEADEKRLSDYLDSLIKHAKEVDRADQFSKCAMYSESDFSIVNMDGLVELISSVERLLEAQEYKEIIQKHIEQKNLISLYKDLISKYIEEQELNLKKQWVNEIVTDVKRKLQSRTAKTRVSDVDLYELAMNKEKVKRFDEIVLKLKKESVIKSIPMGDFKVQIEKRPFLTAAELKKICGKRSASFVNSFSAYDQPYEFLKRLIEIDEIPDNLYYEFFANVEYKILNKYGFEVSGGERAEFNLLQQINDAYSYDMLFIDEPESSFDNIFLREHVNNIIKEISKVIPVVIVTHNNTVGESIKPDYIIHTERIIDSEGVKYVRYCGLPTDKELIAFDGTTRKNRDVMLDCLEAGEIAYNERRRDYEMLKD